MYFLWKHFVLGFTALLPLVNPLGTALIFLGLVGNAPIETYRALSRRIAVNMIVFFAVIELIGSYLLGFFGISLPIMQVSGGIVIALIGFSMLNDNEVQPNPEKAHAAQPAITQAEIDSLKQRALLSVHLPDHGWPRQHRGHADSYGARPGVDDHEHRLSPCRLVYRRPRAQRHGLLLLRLRAQTRAHRISGHGPWDPSGCGIHSLLYRRPDSLERHQRFVTQRYPRHITRSEQVFQ